MLGQIPSTGVQISGHIEIMSGAKAEGIAGRGEKFSCSRRQIPQPVPFHRQKISKVHGFGQKKALGEDETHCLCEPTDRSDELIGTTTTLVGWFGHFVLAFWWGNGAR